MTRDDSQPDLLRGDHARLLAWELIVPSHDDVLSGARGLRCAGYRFDETERECVLWIREAPQYLRARE